jgi:hypothetical protein
MNTEPENSLERFIDDELKRTPNFKAPADLADRVMSRVAAPPDSWWQSAWVCWPWGAKLVSILLFTALAWASMHEFATLAATINFQSHAEEATRLAQWLHSAFGHVPEWLIPFQNHWLCLSLVAFGMTVTFVIGVGNALWPSLRRKN